MLGVHEIAVTTSVALAFAILTALGLSEVGNRGKLSTNDTF
jgi:hypothetical protein